MNDLTVFKVLDKKASWGARMKLIEQEFPASVRLDWAKAFRGDVELYGRVLRDILKTDQNVPGRSGPRPALDRPAAERRLKQFMRTDYSELEFRTAFSLLGGGRSHRHLATKTGLDRNLVQRLLAGKKNPTIELMETIAKAFGKEASYFLEYRTAYILGALGSRLENSPEMTVDLYNKLRPRKAG